MDEDYSLSKEQQKQCLYITSELRNSPAASVFNEPVDPRKQNIPNYYKKIRNPQDLGTIYGRLQRGEYKTVVQWEKDIDLVWMNAETYNGKDSYIAYMAKHMKKKFERLKKPLDNCSVSGWTKHIYQLREKFDKMLSVCPPSLQSIVPRNLESASAAFQTPFNAKETANLIKASTMVKTQKDIDQITAILRRNESQVDTNTENLVVDINNLSNNTLHEISAYYRKQLIEQGLPYPNDAGNDDISI
ncbi:hypothetical protein M9Y10_023089 [Tritrichomonas musculus]|uniref:Bromo domain-containing protein n=1 Tax=Tritrichomonas musculus TaxID=1915356 RepID=A0ABR2KU56_9EUKA